MVVKRIGRDVVLGQVGGGRETFKPSFPSIFFIFNFRMVCRFQCVVSKSVLGYEREVYVGNVRYLVKKKKRLECQCFDADAGRGTDLLDGYMTLLSGSRAWNGRAIVVVSTKCSGMSKRGALLRGGGNYGISAIVTIYDDETYYSDSSS